MNFNFYILLACLTFFYSENSYAQKQTKTIAVSDVHSKCGSHEYLQQMQAKNPAMYDDAVIESWIQRQIAEDKANGITQRATYRIPVVVHVIHEGQAVGVQRNISAEQVMSQIRVLNEDYNRTNADTSNTRAIFLDVAGSLDIEFVPAVVDPDGNLMAEPGIDRVNGLAEFGVSAWSGPGGSTDATLKPGTIWDPSRYMNMWTVLFSSSGLLGYAQFPQINIPGNLSDSDATTDGVVMNYRAFGSNFDEDGNEVNNFNLINLGERGRTTTHEVGHWLGLRHIWGDTDCSGDDYVDDTPLQGSDSPFSSSCNHNLNTCTTTDDLPDQLENYMDYSGDACMNMFTAGQATRMETVLLNAPRRSTLLTSNVWQDPDDVVTASFTTSGEMGCTPFLVAFTNASTAGSEVDALNSWEWNFDLTGEGGASPATYSGENPPNVTFSNEATYTIQLTVSNGTESDVYTITVDAVNERAFNHLNGGSLVLQGSGGWGYVSGHNDYSDQAKAEYFDDLPDGETLTGANFVFGKAAGNPTTLVNFAVWDNDGANGWPGTKLATATKLISEINELGVTSVDFDDIVIDGPVYIGIEGLAYSAISQDTIALATNSDGETSPTTAWEQWEGGDWYPFNDYTSTETTWELDVSLAVYAIFECEAIEAPEANFEADDLNVCTGVPVLFTDQSTGSPISWLWNFGDGNTSILQNPTHTYTTGGNKTVTLTVTNSEGSDTKIKTNYISVQQEPVGFEGNASTTTICNGESVDLSMSGTFGGDYSWELNGNTIANGMNTSQSPTATTTYTAVCDNGVCKVTDDVIITVNALPAVPTITASGATLTANSAVATAWQWSDGSGAISGANSNTYTATVSGAYTVEITDANGCSSSSSVFNLSLDPPVAAFTVSATTICDGQSVQFTDGSTNSPTSWSWDFGDESAASLLQNPSHTYAAGTYTVTLTATNDFGNDSEVKTDLITVNVIPGAPVISEDGYTLTASGSGTFQWYLNGNAINDANSATYTATQDGNYTVTVTTDGCTSALSGAVTVANTAVIDKALDAAITVFPNPVYDIVKVQISNNNVGRLSLSLVDVTGRTILTQTSIKANTTLDMSSLSSGVYLLKFVNNDGKFAVKQIVKH